MWASREEEAAALAETSKPVARLAVRASFHARRYFPLYALATAWITIAAVLPTVDSGGSSTALGQQNLTQAAPAAGDAGAATNTAAAPQTGPAGPATGTGAAVAPTGATGAPGRAAPGTGPAGGGA